MLYGQKTSAVPDLPSDEHMLAFFVIEAHLLH